MDRAPSAAAEPSPSASPAERRASAATPKPNPEKRLPALGSVDGTPLFMEPGF